MVNVRQKTINEMIKTLRAKGDLDRSVLVTYEINRFIGMVVFCFFAMGALYFILFSPSIMEKSVGLFFLVVFFIIEIKLLEEFSDRVLLYNLGISTYAEVTICYINVWSRTYKYSFVDTNILDNKEARLVGVHFKHVKGTFSNGYPKVGDKVKVLYMENNPKNNDIYLAKIHKIWCFDKAKNI